MIATVAQTVNPFSAPAVPLPAAAPYPTVEYLPIGEIRFVKVFTVRPIELATGPGYCLTVVDEFRTMSWNVTPEQLADYLRTQADGFTSFAQATANSRKPRQRRGA